MSIRIIFHDGVFKNPIVFIFSMKVPLVLSFFVHAIRRISCTFYKYVLFVDKIAVFLTLELLELIFHGSCWKSPHFETFKLMK